MAETAELAVKLKLDNAAFNRGIATSQKRLGGIGKTAKTVGKGIAVGMGVVAVGGLAILGSSIKDGLDSLKTLESTTADVAAAPAVPGTSADGARPSWYGQLK